MQLWKTAELHHKKKFSMPAKSDQEIFFYYKCVLYTYSVYRNDLIMFKFISLHVLSHCLISNNMLLTVSIFDLCHTTKYVGLTDMSDKFWLGLTIFFLDRSDCPGFIQVACKQNGVTKGAKPGKKQNSRSAQNSSKRMKRIDLRQNVMKNGTRTVNRWCMTGRRCDENALYGLCKFLRGKN
jgi:hypothetical protein